MHIPRNLFDTEPLATGLGRPTRAEPKPAAPHVCSWVPVDGNPRYVKCAGCNTVTLAELKHLGMGPEPGDDGEGDTPDLWS